MTSDQDRSWLTGVIADLPSPFDAGDELDLAAFEILCERQIAAGATALLVGETAGEMATLTMDEHDRLVRTAVDRANGRIKVISGAGSNSTSQAISLIRRAEAAGADAVMSVVPYYNKPTQAGIEAHFRAIAGSTALPIIVHDNPGCCAQAMTDETLLRLSEHHCVIGLRDGSGSTTRPQRLRAHLPADFRMLSGDDASALAYLAQGGDGIISAVANLAPGPSHDMMRAFRRRDLDHAAAVMERLAPLGAALAHDAASAIKYALGLCNLCSPRVRLPMVALRSDQKAAITQAMATVLGP